MGQRGGKILSLFQTHTQRISRGRPTSSRNTRFPNVPGQPKPSLAPRSS